jgi:SAM-dependent methyltransferase
LKKLEQYQFNTVERGDRMRPHRSGHSYWYLKLLLDKMRRVADSESLPPGAKVLDYGCGNKPYRELFVKKFEQYIGADLPGNPDADIIIGEAGEIPVADDSFDCVLSTEVMEHTTDPRFYLQEVGRVTKPGGSLVLSVPAIWVYHPDPIDYWRWTIAGLQYELRRAGFDIVLVQGVFGPESSALQLWQDATAERLPRRLQSLYIRLLQWLIGRIERRQPDKVSDNAAGYVVLARKKKKKDALADV